MGKHVQAPPTPDFAAAAQAQGAANTDAARQSVVYSNPDINTPYGSQNVTFGFNPLTSQWDHPIISQTLTPAGQATVDQQQATDLGLSTLANQQTGNVANILNTPFSFNGAPQTSLNAPAPIGAAPGLQSSIDTSGIAKMPINAGTTAQQAIMSRLQPQLDRQRTSLETQLVNQGLRPGGEAYDNAIRDFGQQENDQRTQAALQGLGLDLSANQQGFGQAQAQGEFGNNAALAGYNAALSGQQQGFNQALQSGQFGNTAQQQALAQALQLRDQPLNEITGLLSGGQIQNPQFSPYQGANVQPTPVFQGVQNQAAWDQNAYNQQVAQQNGLMSGLFGLGGSILGGPLGGMIGRGVGSLFR